MKYISFGDLVMAEILIKEEEKELKAKNLVGDFIQY
jgi:hypothetical protein